MKQFGDFFVDFIAGNYFCFDIPGALQDQIIDDMEVDHLKYTLLYSLYSWPNVVLCFFGGFFIDKVVGVRWGTILTCIITLCGQLMFAFGAFAGYFWLMGIGRFIFGIGGEVMAVNALIFY